MSSWELQDRWPECEWRNSADLRFISTRPVGEDRPTLERFQVREQHGRPWLIDLREPVSTKAPSPALTIAHSCFIRTIIFYIRPLTVRPWSSFWRDGRGKLHIEKPGCGYERWGCAEFTLDWNDIVEFSGVEFSITAPRVRWRCGRWWGYYSARRVRKEDRR